MKKVMRLIAKFFPFLFPGLPHLENQTFAPEAEKPMKGRKVKPGRKFNSIAEFNESQIHHSKRKLYQKRLKDRTKKRRKKIGPVYG